MGRARRLLSIVSLLLTLLLAVPSRSGALLPPVGWTPDSWGLVPFPAAGAAWPGGAALLHFTRRIVPDPTAKGRFMMGHLLNGLYQSASGGGWVTMSPHCLNTVRALAPGAAKLAEDTLHLLGGCGVEGLAYDLQDPLGMYASTYNFNLGLQPNGTLKPSLDYGGVYRAEIPVGPVGPIGPTPPIGPVPPQTVPQLLPKLASIPTAGVAWTNILNGVRGNAIAVKHLPGVPQATIVVGRIQQSDSPAAVGTDSNPWCNAYIGSLPTGVSKCSPSLYISYDSGSSWVTKYFTPPAGCANGTGNPATSSQLVGNLAFDPVNPNVIYASANSGLYYSIDNGVSWNLAVDTCGNDPGVAITIGAPGTQRIYVGTKSAAILTAQTGPSGPVLPLSTIPTPAIAGRMLSVMLDARDTPPVPGAQQRTFFVGAWSNQPTDTQFPAGTGAVYRVTDNGDGTAKVVKYIGSLLEPLKATLAPYNSLLPYPLIYDHQVIRPSLFLAQHPLAADAIYASTVAGGAWVRTADCAIPTATQC